MSSSSSSSSSSSVASRSKKRNAAANGSTGNTTTPTKKKGVAFTAPVIPPPKPAFGKCTFQVELHTDCTATDATTIFNDYIEQHYAWHFDLGKKRIEAALKQGIAHAFVPMNTTPKDKPVNEHVEWLQRQWKLRGFQTGMQECEEVSVLELQWANDKEEDFEYHWLKRDSEKAPKRRKQLLALLCDCAKKPDETPDDTASDAEGDEKEEVFQPPKKTEEEKKADKEEEEGSGDDDDDKE